MSSPAGIFFSTSLSIRKTLEEVTIKTDRQMKTQLRSLATVLTAALIATAVANAQGGRGRMAAAGDSSKFSGRQHMGMMPDGPRSEGWHPNAPMPFHGGRMNRHAGPLGNPGDFRGGPGMRHAEMLPGLTEQQIKDIKALREKQADGVKKLRQESFEKMKALREDHHKKFLELLTPEQRKVVETPQVPEAPKAPVQDGKKI
jgi:Spy/CpxP family protein refolding chaperone